MNYIIWGAGETGRIALHYLGYERVDGFVDKNMAGSFMDGKTVCHPDTLQTRILSSYIIAIASQNYSEEIELEIKRFTGVKYFVFDKNVIKQERIFLPLYCVHKKIENIPYSRIIASYHVEKCKNILIYGANDFLDFLVCELYFQCRHDSQIYVYDEVFCEKNNLKVKKAAAIEKYDLVIINKRRKDMDIADWTNIVAHNTNIIDIYDSETMQSEFTHNDLKKYKDIHKGKRIFVIGNGPSLNISDLDKLAEKGEYSFAVNKIYRIFSNTQWRPTYWGMSDARAIQCIQDELRLEIPKIPCTCFMTDYYNFADIPLFESVEYVHMFSEEYFPNRPRFSSDITKGVYWGYTVTFDLCLQISYYMGFSEIYLIGMDNTNVGKLTDNNNHFAEDYFSDKEKIEYENIVTEWDKINKAYEKAESYSRQHGFRIYNATRGGKLEVFERIDFDKLFE